MVAETTELAVEDTLGILSMPGVTTRHSSRGLGWPGVLLSVQDEQPYAASFGGTGNHLLILHLDGPVRVTRGRAPRACSRMIGPGGLFLHPAGRDLDVTLGGRLRTLHIYLDQAVVNRAADRPVRLSEEIGETDPLLEHLLIALDGVARTRAEGSQLYVDTLVSAVSAQLVERHSVSRATIVRPHPSGGGLRDRELRRATDLMRARLAENLSLHDLAAAVGLSESQFLRAFKARTGSPPHRYLVGLRIDHARRLLRTTELPIAQVATACGFAHQEHLTRVMRARLGTTPAALRASSS